MTYDYYAPTLLVNPYIGESILEVLPEKYYSIIFNYLFKLNNELQQMVDDFKAKNFGAYNIGIQIRNPSLSKETGKKDHQGFPVPPLYLYAQMAEVQYLS